MTTRAGTRSPAKLCGARTRAGGSCGQPAVVGNKRCRLHGGVGKKQDENRMREIARRSLPSLAEDLPENDPERDPIEGFMREYRRTIQAIRYWDAEVANLESQKALVFGVTKIEVNEATEFPGENTTFESKLNIAYESRFRERSHLNDLVKTYLAGRMADVAAAREARLLDMWQSVIDALVSGLGHDPHDPGVRTLVSRVLAG